MYFFCFGNNILLLPALASRSLSARLNGFTTYSCRRRFGGQLFFQSLVVQKGFMRIDSMICVFDYRNLFSFTFGQGGGLDDDDGRAVVDNTHCVMLDRVAIAGFFLSDLH